MSSVCTSPSPRAPPPAREAPSDPRPPSPPPVAPDGPWSRPTAMVSCVCPERGNRLVFDSGDERSAGRHGPDPTDDIVVTPRGPTC